MRTEMLDLKIGDTIEVWWNPRRDTIIDIQPYVGRLACLSGGKIAYFAIMQSGMTLEAAESCGMDQQTARNVYSALCRSTEPGAQFAAHALLPVIELYTQADRQLKALAALCK